MATATKKRPAFLTEPGEAKEAPADEVREGSEAEEAPKTSRKRSAKGAKETKAPMDAECGCSGAKKGQKCTCDGGCGKAMKDGSYAMKGRNDALTPQEYLAACDLGIQGRSRPYIRSRLDTAMTLTPASIRADLKCGKGSISPGEKCTKGQAQKVDPKAKEKSKGLGTALKVAAGVALVGAAAYGAKKYGPKAVRNAKASMLKTKRSLRTTTREYIRSQLKKEGATPAQWAEWAKSAPKSGSTATERERFKDFFYKNTPGARRPKADSIYASGFALDTNALAI